MADIVIQLATGTREYFKQASKHALRATVRNGVAQSKLGSGPRVPGKIAL